MARPNRLAALVFVAILLAGALAPSVAGAEEDSWEHPRFEIPGFPPIVWFGPYDNTLAGASTGMGDVPALYEHTFQTSDNSAPDFATHDRDYASFTAVAGHAYTIQAYPSAISVANPALRLYNSSGMQLRGVDDGVMGDSLARILWICPAGQGGTYYAEAIDWVGPSVGQTYRFQFNDNFGMPPWTTHRPDAPDRYTLAANLALAGWPSWTGVDDVIVVCGADRAAADPLAASGLAGVYDAPVLLVQTDPTRVAVPTATKNALAAIRTATGVKPQIHVVGGPASVTPGHVAVLKAYDKDGVIDRIGGIDRYQVAANVAARMRSVLGAAYPKTALFVNGHDAAYFWNAMAAGPIAFRMHYPILLTTQIGLPATTNAQKGYYTKRYLVGTPVDTNPAVQTTLGATRIGWAAIDGSTYDRRIVARRLAEYAADSTRRWEGYGDPYSFTDIAYANRLADSLVGGTFMGKGNGTYAGALLFAANANQLDPIVLAPMYSGRMTGVNREFLEARGYGDNRDAWILGGTASMSLVVENNIGSALNNIY